MTYLVDGSWYNPKGHFEPPLFYNAAMRLEGKLARTVYADPAFRRLSWLRRLR